MASGSGGTLLVSRKGFSKTVSGTGIKRHKPKKQHEGALYRYCYYLGAMTIIYSNRMRRRMARTFQPAKEYLKLLYKTEVTDRWELFCSEVRDAAGDMETVKKRLSAAKGVAGKCGELFRVIVDGVTKHDSLTRKVCNIAAPALSILVLILTINHYANLELALSVNYHDENIGYIKNESVYTAANELVNERVTGAYSTVEFAENPYFALTVVDEGQTMLKSADVCDSVLGLTTDELVEAYGLKVGNELIGAVKSEGDLTYILECFLNGFKTGAANETVEFVDFIETEYGYYPTSVMMTSEELKSAITATHMATEYHTVKKGDTQIRVAEKYGMTLERLQELNPNIDELLYPNRRIKIETERNVVGVQRVYQESYTSSIAYGSKTEKNSSMYVGTKKLKTKGVKGVERITEEVTVIDGEEVSRKVVDRSVLSEPVDEVYYVGSKAKPTTTKKKNNNNYSSVYNGSSTVKGTGKFMWPVPGYKHISSPYGQRWGRLHKGIDISGSGINGKSIVAADSGIVTGVYSSSSGYGKYLKIDHGNGYSTLYAHCSKILVKAGQKVTKGDVIAKVGNTGNSTGPHLHFEIRVNNVPKNPQKYL